MRKLLLLSILLLCFDTQAQILERLKDKAKRTAKDLERSAKEGFFYEMNKMKEEYDTTSFNYAIALSDNASLFQNKERFGRQKVFLIKGLYRADERRESPIDNARESNSIGEMLYANNKYKMAELSFKGTVTLLEGLAQTQHPVYAQALSNLGLLYHTTGRYAQAEKYTELGLEANKKIGASNAPYGASINNKAVLSKDLGKYAEAESLIEQALLIIKQSKGENSLPYAICLNNKAMIFQTLGRYDKAEEFFRNSLRIAQPLFKEKSLNYTRLQMNLGLLYQDMKKYNEAEQIYNQVKASLDKQVGKRHPDYAHLLNNLAAFYLEVGKSEEVEKLLLQAADIYKNKFGENHPSYANTISNLGNFYRVNDKLDKAEPLLLKAISIRKSTIGEKHPDYIQSYENLALLYWQKGDLKKAVEEFRTILKRNMEFVQNSFPAMSEYEKTKFWDLISPKFQMFYSLVCQAYTQDKSLLSEMYNSHINIKGLLLNETTKVKNQILASNDKELINLYLTWIDQKEMLANHYTMSKEELAEERINMDSLENVSNQTERQLSQQSALFARGYEQKLYDWTEIKKILDTNEAAVEIIRIQRFDKKFTDKVIYAALVLTKNQENPEIAIMENGKEMETQNFKFYKNAIRSQIDDTKSYSAYWQAIHQLVKDKKVVYLSCDGTYNQINITTLKSASGKFVIEEKEIEVVANTRYIPDVKATSPTPKGTNAILIGFPDYGSENTISDLPGTKIEVEKISQILKTNKLQTNLLLAQSALEEEVKKINNPKILHIATHGYFLADVDNFGVDKIFGISTSKARENPLLRAGLMLAGAEKALNQQNNEVKGQNNGILTAFEVMTMQLENTDLVVLSACETGLGDVKHGEGVYGLQRAFQIAGAKSIIMSLWKVDDNATQELMQSFYLNWLKTNDKNKAFATAQNTLKAKYKSPQLIS
ncbi:MAG: CHAT domain-containing protein [Thermoflexibacter sp.]|nr:CHAT domain-containing protein [Thermoflexibacter sp.]